MATYKNGQYVYPHSEGNMTSISASIYEVNRDTTKGQSLDYQQIVIKPDANKIFEKNKSYYIKLAIPRNKNFNMEYILRLITIEDTDENQDLDEIQNYEAIKNIFIPYIALEEEYYNTIIFYQEQNVLNVWNKIAIKNSSNSPIVPDTHAAIVVEIPLLDEIDNVNIAIDSDHHNYNSNYLADKVLFYNNFYWKKTNNEWVKLQKFGNIIATLTCTWIEDQTEEKINFDFIFTPLYNNYNAIYFYLIPTNLDETIRWGDYYGRHIDNPSETIAVSIYEIKNILDSENKTYTNIGVWGRSGLPMAINGVEIRIGPSSYYELKDYEISSLCIAAESNNPRDKYTVDYQYKD